VYVPKVLVHPSSTPQYSDDIAGPRDQRTARGWFLVIVRNEYLAFGASFRLCFRDEPCACQKNVSRIHQTACEFGAKTMNLSAAR